jgi:hypothetical protein
MEGDFGFITARGSLLWVVARLQMYHVEGSIMEFLFLLMGSAPTMSELEDQIMEDSS